MSKSLTVNAVATFEKEVKQAYQGFGMLRDTVRVRTGVRGSTKQFPKIGKGVAARRQPQTPVIVMNVVHSNVVATLLNWNAAEYSDVFDQQEVNYEERAELAQVIAGAISRREDQIILDALDAASTTLTVAKTIGATAAMDTAKIREAKFHLDNSGVPKGKGRALIMSARGLSQLLGDAEATTFDKNTIKMLFDGEITHWVGFDIKVMEDRDEGGLPLDGTPDRTSYAYHRNSTGIAIGIDKTMHIDWIPDRTSWLVNQLFKAGAVAVDALGIVEITTTE